MNQHLLAAADEPLSPALLPYPSRLFIETTTRRFVAEGGACLWSMDLLQSLQ